MPHPVQMNWLIPTRREGSAIPAVKADEAFRIVHITRAFWPVQAIRTAQTVRDVRIGRDALTVQTPRAARVARAFAAALALLAVLLGQAGPAHSDARFFQASQRHFEETAAKAATLVADLSYQGDVNACNYFTATAMLYAVRCHALVQLTDLSARLRSQEDRVLVRQKILESQAYLARHTLQDIASLEALSAATKSAKVRDLGLRLVNELRVFDTNSKALAR